MCEELILSLCLRRRAKMASGKVRFERPPAPGGRWRRRLRPGQRWRGRTQPPLFSPPAAVLSDYDSADLEENASHSEVRRRPAGLLGGAAPALPALLSSGSGGRRAG